MAPSRSSGLARSSIFLLSDPDGIEDVLITHASSFAKGRALERAKRTLGDGLLTSEGAYPSAAAAAGAAGVPQGAGRRPTPRR